MNIHPLFVHFPIALLVLYALFELVTPFIKNVVYRANIERAKALFVILGALTIIPTLATGDLAAELIGENALIERHEFFATATTVVFFLLAGGYALRVLDTLGWSVQLSRIHRVCEYVFSLWHFIARIIMGAPARFILAMLGLVLITITGGLGASIVYGPDIDPIVKFIYSLLL